MHANPYTLWRHGRRRFALPDGVTIPGGDLLLRSGVREMLVDRAAVETYEITAAEARELGRKKIEEAAEALRGRAQAWLDEHPEEGGPAKRTLEAFVEAFRSADGSGREHVGEVIATAVEKLANGPENAARVAELRERIATARARHLEQNPRIAEAAAALEKAVMATLPDISDQLQEALKAVSATLERVRSSRETASPPVPEPNRSDDEE